MTPRETIHGLGEPAVPLAAVLLEMVLAVAVGAPGGEPPPRLWVHPEFAKRMAGVKTVGIAPPAVTFFEVTPTLAVLRRPEWGDEVKDGFASAIESGLRRRQLAPRRLEQAGAEARAEMEGVQRLFEAVVQAILQATYANEFPAKMKRFEYHLGDLASPCRREGVQALVVASGTARLLAGEAGRALPPNELDSGRISLALVDCSGALLWFESARTSSADLRLPSQISAIARAVLDTLPELPR